jgi:hypothetical protein
MVRDHTAVNKQALALVAKLKVKPQDNATSKALSDGAKAKREQQDQPSPPPPPHARLLIASAPHSAGSSHGNPV